MKRQRDEGHYSADYCVPVEDSRVGPDAPVRPEWQEEITVGAERDAADNVSEGCTIEDGQQQTRKEEQAVKECPPDSHLYVHAQFNTYASHYQQPEHDH